MLWVYGQYKYLIFILSVDVRFSHNPHADMQLVFLYE